MSDFFKRAEQMFRESAEDFCQKQLKASSQSLDAFIARNTDPINKGGWAGFQQVFFGCPVRNHKKLAATFIKRARKQRRSIQPLLIFQTHYQTHWEQDHDTYSRDSNNPNSDSNSLS